MKPRFLVVLPAALILAGAQCPSNESVKEVVPDGCNALAYEWDCMLPFPSDQFLVEDTTMPSGHRVLLPGGALPAKDDGSPVDMLDVHPADGYSHLPAILVVIPAGVDGTQMHTLDRDVSASTSADSATVIIDADSGERVLHMSELDPRTTDPAKQALMLRPLTRLKNQTRYIVALRGLRSASGTPIAPPEGFRRIRDRAPDGSPILAAMQARFDDQVFPALDRAGLARQDLQLAWDFTTGSVENLTRDMLDARAQLFDALDLTPPAITIVDVRDDDSEHIFRRIEGRIEVPMFLAVDELGAWLNRDGAGRVARNGSVQVAFTVLIPRSVKAAPAPSRVVQYGHGFFGQRSEMSGSFLTPYIDATKMVAAGVDWWGMSLADSGVVLDDILNNMDEMMRFTERVHQGMMNQLALEHVIRHGLADLPELQLNGTRLLNPDEHYFYGISQGHILGGTFMSLTREISRGALSVGGAGLFSIIAMRAMPFETFYSLINERMTDPLEHQKLFSLAQISLDRIDPGTYAPFVRSNAFADSPSSREILMHIGLGDTAVPTIGGEVHARSLGLPQLSPVVRSVAGIEESAGPLSSALVEFDFGIATPLPGTWASFPEEENTVHEGVRRTAAGQRQTDAFFRPGGMITATCDGPCNPE